VPTDLVILHTLWNETDTRLDSLAKQVREGVAVAEASNFCRWLRFSCVLEILQPHEQDLPLPIRASELRRKVNDLIYECGEWYRLHERSKKPRDAYISASALESINDRLGAIEDAIHLSRSADASPLRVIGGTNAA